MEDALRPPDDGPVAGWRPARRAETGSTAMDTTTIDRPVVEFLEDWKGEGHRELAGGSWGRAVGGGPAGSRVDAVGRLRRRVGQPARTVNEVGRGGRPPGDGPDLSRD